MLTIHRYGSKKYDANGNEIGTLTKDGLSDTVSTKASPLEAVAGQTEQYSILPPKKASSMVLSDGTNTTERLAIKPGTVYTVSGGTVHTAVQPESSAKIQSITDMNGRTDKDYIYFTDKDHLIRGSVETDTVYAYYFGGEYGEFTGLTNGVEPVRTYKDSQNNIVYVYQPPLNSTISTNDYPKVIFTNGAENSANRKMTKAITYELGKGYTPNVDRTRPYGPDTDAYQVDTRIVGTSDDVYTRTSNTRQFTFIMNGTEYSHQLYLWDNLHIIFYGADGISKTGNTDGYVLFEDDNDHRNQPFVIDADPENPVEVKLALKDDESKYVPNDTGHAQPTTDENGILIVGELEWGNYYFYVEQAGDDPRFGIDDDHDFSDDTENHRIRITNPSRYADSVYKLKANYGGLSDEFDIVFARQNQTPKEYETTIIFKADPENYSYFIDNGTVTSQYAFTFTMTKDQDNQYQVYSVKHNGTVIAIGASIRAAMSDALTEMQNSFRVNEAYSDVKAFAKWVNDTEEISNLSYLYFEALVKETCTDETIVFTAQLS